MTGMLQDLLARQADATEAPSVDLDRIVAAGNRQIRRRRLGTAAVAAATVAVLAVAWTVVRPGTSDEPAGPFTERRPTYAAGATIHYGNRTIDLDGHQVSSFVQTDAGFVISTAAEVFLADGNEVTKIGDGNASERLAADDTGPLAGWVDHATDGAGPGEYVVYDTARRREELRTDLGGRAKSPTGSADPPLVAGIDDGSAYLYAADGLHRLEIRSGRDVLVKQLAAPGWFVDAAAGRIAFAPFSDVQDATTVVVNSDPRAQTPRFDGFGGDLSPDAAHLVTAAQDQTVLFDVATGRSVPLRLDGHQVVAPGHWLDSDRFAAWSVRDDPDPGSRIDIQLVSCTVAAGQCTVQVRRIGILADGIDPGFRLPDGRPWEGGR